MHTRAFILHYVSNCYKKTCNKEIVTTQGPIKPPLVRL